MRRFILVALLALPSFALAQDSSDSKVLKDGGLPTDGPGLLAYFKKRAAKPATTTRINALVEDLGDDCFFTRLDATEALVLLGARSKPLLRKALKHTDPEVRHRAGLCLRDIDSVNVDIVDCTTAGVRELARLRPQGTLETLISFLPASGDDQVLDATWTALAQLGVKDGVVLDSLRTGLTDKSPAVRAGAAIAICRAGGADQLPAVKKLLADEHKETALSTALALAQLKDKDAVPILIEAITMPDTRLTGLAEELLVRLAKQDAPAWIDQDDDRGKLKKAWQSWWTKNNEKLDAKFLAAEAKQVGHTTVILLDKGEVLAMDSANRVVWKLSDVPFPLDIQRLPDDRVLLAEYRSHRVTERNSKGQVVWEEKFDEPVSVQRLANGNTFMANRLCCREVEKDGTEKFRYNSGVNWQIMRARKLESGDTLIVSQQGVGGPTRFMRIDKDGRLLKSYPVEVATSGGRIDLTPSGNVLIPEMHNNRVVERNMEGQEIRTFAIDTPVVALSLPNGHIIITSNTENRAVELNRKGEEVWQYKRETRVTRAVR